MDEFDVEAYVSQQASVHLKFSTWRTVVVQCRRLGVHNTLEANYTEQ
jgi:hypothetical protein